MYRRAIFAAASASAALVAAVMASASLAASCSLDCLFVHNIIIAAPERPHVWQGDAAFAYRLAWRDELGLLREAIIADDEEVAICVRRGQRQAILATPLWNGARLLPAGALYPRDLAAPPGDLPSYDPGRMALSFASGYAAAVAAVIMERGVDPWAYPVEKLAEIPIAARKDPWDLPPWKAADAILGGTFRATAFPSARSEFTLPAGEQWHPESPFCAMGGEEASSSATLADGLHFFFSEERTLAVRVEEGKVCLPPAIFRR
jgi:hypothetical protein